MAQARRPNDEPQANDSLEAFRMQALGGLASKLDPPLNVIDVGCRWGPAEIWQPLGPHFTLTGFDPDPEECRKLSDQFSSNPAVNFVPLALGPASGKTALHLTAEPACSSLYPPDEKIILHRPALALASPVGIEEIEVTTLDEWLIEQDIKQVDFIKIDTQGSELGVLQGAERALGSVRVLEVEVEFNPIYEGQPLFGNVDAFLRARGFVLWQFKNIVHYGVPDGLSKFNSPDVLIFDDESVDFIGRGGQVFWANAFYVAKELAYPPDDAEDQQDIRDACLAGALGFWDLAARRRAEFRRPV